MNARTVTKIYTTTYGDVQITHNLDWSGLCTIAWLHPETLRVQDVELPVEILEMVGIKVAQEVL